MVRRALLVAAMAAAVGVAQLRDPADPGRPVAVIGHAEPTTSLPAPATTLAAPAPAPPTTTVKVVVANRSSTVVQADGGRVTVVNEGSATADTGANTAIGPGSASIVNGPVTVVGNSADVRVSRP